AAPAATAAPRRHAMPEAPQRPLAEARLPTPPPERIETHGAATVLTLGRHMCKWPIGDPSSTEFTFCGRRAADERPYCVEHARLAYQPQQTKKKSSANELARSLRRYI
ncbi:MAG: GcrA cell cycle regulator, partial [Alphaproteobacteria bacterium]|nr:GcrA cell cycle regulator [Alphaproteobacteria bacterium]